MPKKLEEIVYRNYGPNGFGNFEYVYKFKTPLSVFYHDPRLQVEGLTELSSSGETYGDALRNFSYLFHGEFERILHTPPHLMTQKDNLILRQMRCVLDFDEIMKERDKEVAKEPQLKLLQILNRDPYVVKGSYIPVEGVAIPDELVPRQLKEFERKENHKDWFYAVVAMDLDSNQVTSLDFLKFLQKHSKTAGDTTHDVLISLATEHNVPIFNL